jgi:hypothetical protein
MGGSRPGFAANMRALPGFSSRSPILYEGSNSDPFLWDIQAARSYVDLGNRCATGRSRKLSFPVE